MSEKERERELVDGVSAAVLNQFVGLLEEKTSVEDLVEWGQSVLDTTLLV